MTDISLLNLLFKLNVSTSLELEPALSMSLQSVSYFICSILYSLFFQTEKRVKNDVMDKNRVVFNIGGSRFETLTSTIIQRCGLKWYTNLQELSDGEDDVEEFFIDRNPIMFQCILDYCRTGHLHIPHNICGPYIRQELEFWDISPALIRPCCWAPFASDDHLRFAG